MSTLTEADIQNAFCDHLRDYLDGKTPFGVNDDGRCKYDGADGTSCVIGSMLSPTLRKWADDQGAVLEFGISGGSPPEPLPSELAGMSAELAGFLQSTHDGMASRPEVARADHYQRMLNQCLFLSVKSPEKFEKTVQQCMEENIKYWKDTEGPRV